MLRLVALLALCCGVLDGYKFLQNKIPNGEDVPHPCKPNFMWEGVGHKNIAGGGARNPFGEDFDKNGQVWDECICRRDSDGDGRTNGEELGDPDCVWKPADIPAKSDGLSHPGICEPVDSPFCAVNNNWDFCQYDELDCPALEEEGVEIVDVRLNRTVVPADVTTYYCMTFDLGLDPDVEYHMIGTKPLIDNKNVMHHMLVQGCASLDRSSFYDKPHECGMASVKGCDMLGFGLWAVGYPGQCFPAEYGFKAGKGGVKQILIQYHWNNPEKRSDYTDASGLRFYFTRKLRPDSGAILGIGTEFLEIPPGLTSHDQMGYCRPGCSNYMPQSVTVTRVLFHMHYLGRSGKLVQKRNGEVLRVIEDKNYSYDSPVEIELTDPMEFRPGDEMTVTCGYKSTSRAHTTYNGPGTADEMCLVFFYYYPEIPKMMWCESYKSVDICVLPGTPAAFLTSCDVSAPTILGIYNSLMETCNSTVCTAECESRIDQLVRENDCVGGDVQDMLENRVLALSYGERGVHLAKMLHSCDDDWNSELFYIRAGLITNTRNDEYDEDDHEDDHDDSTDSDDEDDKSRNLFPGQCVFDNGPGVAGAGYVGPSVVMVTMTMIYATVLCTLA